MPKLELEVWEKENSNFSETEEGALIMLIDVTENKQIAK